MYGGIIYTKIREDFGFLAKEMEEIILRRFLARKQEQVRLIVIGVLSVPAF